MNADKNKIIGKLFYLLFACFSVFASTIEECDFECPLCLEKFTYTVQRTYSLFGKNLDLKPYGAAIIPSPIPKCVRCGFVFDKGTFTDTEIEKLKVYFADNKLPDFEKNYPNYYYLAQEMILLDAPIENIAWVFLQSVWENKNETDKEFLISNALYYLSLISESDMLYDPSLLVRIDLERRLGKFDSALSLIKTIKKRRGFYKKAVVKMIKYQEKLIADKDIEEHSLP